MIKLLLCPVIGYLLGSISGSITVSRFFYKDDIRKYGSGNAGTTNVLRTYGKGKAAMTILVDFGKTMAAIAIGRLLILYGWGSSMYCLGAVAFSRRDLPL